MIRPMLSSSLDRVDLASLRYPLVVSPKLDGLRCIIWEGVAYSRTWKPFRNRFLQSWAKNYHNMDGELIVGSPTEGLVLERTKALTAFEGEPDFKFHWFDTPARIGVGFLAGYSDMNLSITTEDERIEVVPHYEVTCSHEMLVHEQEWLDQGYEGLMARDPNGPYKNGRSTLREGYLMKLKRFTDGEGVVRSIHEGQTNLNTLQKNELGYAKRSTDADGMVGSGILGFIILEDGDRVAPGIMTHAERAHFLANPQEIVGKTIHWRSFGYGVKDKPRFRRYYGIREDV